MNDHFRFSKHPIFSSLYVSYSEKYFSKNQNNKSINFELKKFYNPCYIYFDKTTDISNIEKITIEHDNSIVYEFTVISECLKLMGSRSFYFNGLTILTIHLKEPSEKISFNFIQEVKLTTDKEVQYLSPKLIDDRWIY